MNSIPKVAAVAGLLVFFLSSCSSKPQPFSLGKDVCDNCKMTIVDPKFGGEVLTKKGKVYKFDDPACMIHFLKSGSLKETDISLKLLVNFQKQNDFIDVNKAILLVSPELKTPMGGDAAAFVSKEDAEKFKITAGGEVATWNDMFNNQSK